MRILILHKFQQFIDGVHVRVGKLIAWMIAGVVSLTVFHHRYHQSKLSSSPNAAGRREWVSSPSLMPSDLACLHPFQQDQLECAAQTKCRT